MRARLAARRWIGALLLLLGGCGGLQPSIGAPGAMPQSRADKMPPLASYELLYHFHYVRDARLGAHPYAGLLAVHGTLYGATMSGGLYHKGAVYSLTTSGIPSVLHSFSGGSDGANPHAGLIDVNGTLYGTTMSGGSSKNLGTVYSVSISGTEKVLHAFKGGSDGAEPLAALTDVNGTLYGTTVEGGGSGCQSSYHGSYIGCGTVFSITTSGQERVRHRFADQPDGAEPFAGLIDVKGILYGTTAEGGAAGSGGAGTVYSVTPAGVEKVLYAFDTWKDGLFPWSGLIYVQGKLYGTTFGGGLMPPQCRYTNCGVVYRISTAGAEQVLYRFSGYGGGTSPEAGLTELNGTLYGTTSQYPGTLFSITTAGVEKQQHFFAGGRDGANPTASLTNLNGTLYGTTENGGAKTGTGLGTVFALTP